MPPSKKPRRKSADAVVRKVEEEFKKWACKGEIHAEGCKCDIGIVCVTAAKQAAENLKPKV